MSALLRVFVISFVVCFTLPSAKAEPTAADRALSTELFQRGRKALLANDLLEACPLLEESLRLDPAGGTLLNLALCHELAGRTASAWAEFHDALAQARREGRSDRVQFAESHIQSLDARLSHLIVTLPPAHDLPGLRVERDGSPLARAVFGVAMPVDPGPHELSASAPGHEAVHWSVNVGAGASTVPTEVPALALTPPQVAAPLVVTPPPEPRTPAPPPVPPGLPLKKKLAIASFAFAIASAAVATTCGVRAIELRDRAEARCAAERCEPEAYALNDRARRNADSSTVFTVLGGVSALSSAWLWWSASPVVEQGSVGATMRVSGRF